MSADDWVCIFALFVVQMNHPTQGATSRWVMPGLVLKWFPQREFSLFDTPQGQFSGSPSSWSQCSHSKGLGLDLHRDQGWGGSTALMPAEEVPASPWTRHPWATCSSYTLLFLKTFGFSDHTEFLVFANLTRVNGNPLQYSRLENPMDREAQQVTVHGVTKSRT